MSDAFRTVSADLEMMINRAVESHQRITELEADLAALRESARWIPVGERLPMDLLPRIVVDESGYVFPSRAVLPYGAGKWMDFDGESVTTRITHWMDLPAPPEPQAAPERKP